MTDILEFFPYDQPRPGQLKMLRWIERNWNNFDIMVPQVPVAGGKSGLNVTVANWANHVHGMSVGITTPDNVLVAQYKKDFNIPTLPKKSQFLGSDYFHAAREEFKNEPIKLMNNYTLLANRAYSNVQCMDEAHELIPMLQDFEGIKIWKHLDYYPDDLRTVADILMWAASLGPSSDLGKKVIKQLSKNPLDYTIVHERAAYRGKERDCLRVYPLTPKNNKPILWPPSKVQKLILMSATIAGPDIEDLGLHNRRVGYLEVPSDIPAANRPVIFEGVAKMGRFRKESDIDKCAEFIKKKEQEHGTRGFVHATYELARELKKRYPKDFIYHDSVDKTRKLNSWLNNKQNTKTFVGCGLTTGLDLKGDICRWQVILKVQYPDLGDPAVMAKANNNPKWYYWSTVKQLLQAYGRVCRTPDDTGTTYVIDSDFILLYNKHRELFSQWFKDAFTF